MVEKEDKEEYIKWLSELSAKSGSIAGGKGANLAEMYNAGMTVPPAFVITSYAFSVLIKEAGLEEKIKEILEKTDIENTQELEQNAEKIRIMIENSKMPGDMQEEILEAYDILSVDKEIRRSKEQNTIKSDAMDILKNSKEPIFVAIRSSATTEDLSTASFAGQQRSFTNIKGEKELINAVKKCFASLYTARAIYYRNKKGFKEGEALLAVVVQKMINSDKSGVIFTKNPMESDNTIILEAVFGLGEGIVSGKIKPDHYVISSELKIKSKAIADKKKAIVRTSSGEEKTLELTKEKSKQQVLTDAEIISLAHIAQKIEEHYKRPQDIEFAIQSGEVFIVQSRPITTLSIKRKEMNVQGEVLLTGLGASPGVASGKVKIIEEMKDLYKIKQGDILVTKMTNPDMVVSMQKSSAIITDEGGSTSHAAIVSREMGIPAVVGVETATSKLKDGMIVTVDGTNGRVYEGANNLNSGENTKKEVLPIVEGTKTKIKVIVDLPDFAERASKSNIKSVGLLRLEGIIANSGKHPMYFFNNHSLEEYTSLLKQGIEKISSYFKEIWIRASDIRTDEYKSLQGAPKEIELNPMLGFHGIRFSLKFLPILEAELEAVKKVAELYPEKKFGIMFPQIISEEEIKKAFELFRKHERENIKIGAMVETPASVQIIRQICKYVKFISFGTNDLTQYTLAVDRGNSEVQYLYDEMHPSILSQMRRVIRICKEYGVETSVCGQAGSNLKMVEFLVKEKIGSISVNADMAYEISKYILELEGKNCKNPIQEFNSKESRIYPIDNTESVEEKIEEKKQEVEEAKERQEKKIEERTGN